jgi:hypothetical protein
MRIRLVGTELFHEEGQKDMTKPIVALQSFANATKIQFDTNFYSCIAKSDKLHITTCWLRSRLKPDPHERITYNIFLRVLPIMGVCGILTLKAITCLRETQIFKNLCRHSSRYVKMFSRRPQKLLWLRLRVVTFTSVVSVLQIQNALPQKQIRMQTQQVSIIRVTVRQIVVLCSNSVCTFSILHIVYQRAGFIQEQFHVARKWLRVTGFFSARAAQSDTRSFDFKKINVS